MNERDFSHQTEMLPSTANDLAKENETNAENIIPEPEKEERTSYS